MEKAFENLFTSYEACHRTDDFGWWLKNVVLARDFAPHYKKGQTVRQAWVHGVGLDLSNSEDHKNYLEHHFPLGFVAL